MDTPVQGIVVLKGQESDSGVSAPGDVFDAATEKAHQLYAETQSIEDAANAELNALRNQ